MITFWQNLLRYPRFFISSLIGLFLILITPLLKILNETKETKNYIFFCCFLVTCLICLGLILNQMLYSE